MKEVGDYNEKGKWIVHLCDCCRRERGKGCPFQDSDKVTKVNNSKRKEIKIINCGSFLEHGTDLWSKWLMYYNTYPNWIFVDSFFIAAIICSIAIWLIGLIR